MIDLADSIVEHLREQGFDGVSLKRLSKLTDKDGIVVRMKPLKLVESYYDGRNVYECPYMAIVRRRSAAEAEEACCDVVNALEDEVLSSANGSFEPEKGGQYVVGAPEELGIDKQNFYVWQAEMACQVTTKGW